MKTEMVNTLIGEQKKFDFIKPMYVNFKNKITEDIIAQCHQCGSPCDTHTNCKNDGCHLLFIQCPKCAETYAGCCSQACMRSSREPSAESRASNCS